MSGMAVSRAPPNATGDGGAPAQEFLLDCPQPVREMLLAILVAVRDAPPPAFLVEQARERDGIPKAEIARRMRRRPEAISRLLSGQGSNPTLDTLIDLIDAIGLELDIQIKRQPRRRESDYSPLKIRSTV
jgi:DNA-binding phage protein